MKIALYSRPENPSLPIIIAQLESRPGLTYSLNPACATGHDVALSFGGDGTFLSSSRKIGCEDIPLFGVNSGRLGFLAAVALDDISGALDNLLAGRYVIEQRSLLMVIAEDDANPPVGASGVAVNEFTIQKSGTAMVSISMDIDGERVASYWADGVIVATSTGSTAYSMSVGGAILAPGCRSLIISPIAPHNLNIRPLVVPGSSHVKISVGTRYGAGATATIDNREFPAPDGSSFELVRAPRMLKIVRLEGHSFYTTLREKLLWGVDARNSD